MIFPATIKGYKVNNEDELHELVDIDIRFKQMENKCEELARELLFAKGKKDK